MLVNTPNQPSKFKTNNDARGTYNTNSQTKFKTSMFKSGLCDYSAYILDSESKRTTRTGANDAAKREDERNKGVIFKNSAPFTIIFS